MPELPEVESLRHLLTQRLLHARILDARFPSPVILRGTNPDDFTRRTSGKTIVSIARRGKYLLFGLSEAERLNATSSKREADGIKGSPDAPDEQGVGAEGNALRLVVHLRMRGGLRVEDAEQPAAKYLCGLLRLDGARELRYYDMWRWGEWWLAPPAPQSTGVSGLDALGVEPLDADFSPEHLRQALASRRSPLKPLLLGQRIVAGLGNIYCDESLHRARLHPARRADTVQAEEVARLHEAICTVLSEAVAQGRVHSQALVDQDANLEHFEGIYTPRVYDRPGRACPTCGFSLQKITFYGRGTTFCPQCQPAVETPDPVRRKRVHAEKE